MWLIRVLECEENNRMNDGTKSKLGIVGGGDAGERVECRKEIVKMCK